MRELLMEEQFFGEPLLSLYTMDFAPTAPPGMPRRLFQIVFCKALPTMCGDRWKGKLERLDVQLVVGCSARKKQSLPK
jgi:hypothetical protein